MIKKDKTKFIFVLILVSILVYVIHFTIFHDLHHIFIYMVEDIAFIPIEVLVVSLIIHRIMEQMEKKKTLEKINMVIGVFFTEVGTKLLSIISDSDKEMKNIHDALIVKTQWDSKEFKSLIQTFNNHSHNVDIDVINLKEIKDLLVYQRDFLLKLVENPVLLEHDHFTNLLMAVFHLEEELKTREEIDKLGKHDKEHIVFDVKRVYSLLTVEWVRYMEHLSKEYPYLFSFAIRTNPFDANAKVEIE